MYGTKHHVMLEFNHLMLQVEEFFKARIRQQYPPIEVEKELDKNDVVRERHRLFLIDRMSQVQGREDILQQVCYTISAEYWHC